MNLKDSLAYKLAEYHNKKIYPFHMPGHKRNIPESIKELMSDIYRIDLTEVDGTDNLHHAEGIIKDAMEFAGKVYGSTKSYFLINGSSCGILSAIKSALDTWKEKCESDPVIIMGSNSHFSAFHAIKLFGIEPDLVTPERIGDMNLAGSIDPMRIQELLSGYRKIHKTPIAVFVTSPTYDGVISDIRHLCDICHEYKVPLIVDAAHGALLPFLDKVCDNGDALRAPVALGADIVVESLHKTLYSLTQTAIIHYKSQIVRNEYLEEGLRIFQSSSPSYVLMSAIDACIRYMEDSADEIRELMGRIACFREGARGLKHLYIWEPENVFDYDRSKIIIGIRNFVNHTIYDKINGAVLQDVLRKDYLIETEMAADRYVLALCGIGDTKEGFDRLLRALSDIDRRMDAADLLNDGYGSRRLPEGLTGKRAKRNIYAYPPGIPIVTEGEIIDEEKSERLLSLLSSGIKIYGL